MAKETVDSSNEIMDSPYIKAPPIECQHCAVASLCLPAFLSDTQMQQMEVVVKHRPVKQTGEHVFRVGEPLHAIYAVRSGSVKIYSLDEQGRERVLGFFFPGELVGLEAIATERFPFSCVALETTGLCAIPYKNLLRKAETLPALNQQMMRIMSSELVKEYDIAGDFTAEERLAAFFITLSTRFEQRKFSSTQFSLSMSRQDIGNFLRLAPETISRLLSRFKKKGLIEVNKKQIEIKNLSTLQEIAGAACCLTKK